MAVLLVRHYLIFKDGLPLLLDRIKLELDQLPGLCFICFPLMCWVNCSTPLTSTKFAFYSVYCTKTYLNVVTEAWFFSELKLETRPLCSWRILLLDWKRIICPSRSPPSEFLQESLTWLITERRQTSSSVTNRDATHHYLGEWVNSFASEVIEWSSHTQCSDVTKIPTIRVGFVQGDCKSCRESGSFVILFISHTKLLYAWEFLSQT